MAPRSVGIRNCENLLYTYKTSIRHIILQIITRFSNRNKVSQKELVGGGGGLKIIVHVSLYPWLYLFMNNQLEKGSRFDIQSGSVLWTKDCPPSEKNVCLDSLQQTFKTIQNGYQNLQLNTGNVIFGFVIYNIWVYSLPEFRQHTQAKQIHWQAAVEVIVLTYYYG